MFCAYIFRKNIAAISRAKRRFRRVFFLFLIYFCERQSDIQRIDKHFAVGVFFLSAHADYFSENFDVLFVEYLYFRIGEFETDDAEIRVVKTANDRITCNLVNRH